MHRNSCQSHVFLPQEVKGYQRKLWKTCLCHFVCLLTLGLPLVLFHWKPHLEIYAKCTPCPLHQADWVLIRAGRVPISISPAVA
uniref:Cation-transporting ATPase n=1 Tax=Naja naja TaxID=35670 RepID=A0A8C7E0W2_NAJNA